MKDIHMIFGGPEIGDSSHGRRNYAREISNIEKGLIPEVSKFAKREEYEITFTADEARRIIHPHNDALVVTLQIANSRVHRILIDNGSSCDVLFMSTFKQMSISGAKLRPIKTPLSGFTGDQVFAEGTISLPVLFGSELIQIIRMVDFLVVDVPSVYNAIIGRPTLTALKAVTSIYHLTLKFPSEGGVGIIRGNQEDARMCHVDATKQKGPESMIYVIINELTSESNKRTKVEPPVQIENARPFGELDPPEDPKKKIESGEEIISIVLDPAQQERTLKIGSNLPLMIRTQLETFLREFQDVFA